MVSQAFLSFSGVSKLQEAALQLGSPGVAKGWGAGVGEVSSASEYFSCVSSPRKFIHGGKHSGLLGCGAPCVRGWRHTDPGEAGKASRTVRSDQGSTEEPGKMA